MANDNDDDDFAGFDDEDSPEDAKEHRKAQVTSVVYQKPGSDFKILKMDDGTTWIGVVDKSTGKGSVIEAAGHMQPSKRSGYADDFKIDKVLNILPYSKDGLKLWLMDRLPDIGEARAEALVKKFPGESLFEVIAKSPERLTEISGITSARAQKIQEAYTMFAHERVIVVELVTFGFAYMKALKASKVRGIKELLRDDPFELVSLPGFSFQMLKDFVLNYGNPYGMSASDPRVVRAYARELLTQAAKGDRKFQVPDLREGGNCYLTRAQLLHLLSNYSAQYSAEQLQQIVGSSKHIVWLHPQGYVMLQGLDAAERNVADIIAQKLSQRTGQVHLLAFEGTRLDDSQKLAASALTQLPIAVMTGGPGTGKTTTLKAALDVMVGNGEVVKLASFTGKAAKRMTETTGREATTIHKLLGAGPVEDEFGVTAFGFKHNENNPVKADVVVIDEASMLDIELASSLFSALGSARIVLVGDEDQLPPVGPGQLLTDVMKRRTVDGKERHVVPTYRLQNVYRQGADSWVIDNARRIINGEIPSLKNQSDFQFIEARSSNPKAEIIQAVISIYEQSKAKGQLKDLQVLCPMKKPDAGASTFAINIEVQKRLNPASTRPKDYPNVAGGDKYTIFESDKVIYTQNDADLGLVNGDTGYVEALDVPRGDVMNTSLLMRVDGKKNPKREDELFELRGANFGNLLLAYAMTIHKSQGSEWPEVVVVMDRAHETMLKRQLLYTAVTRTSKYLRIVGQRSAVEMAARSKRSNIRQTLLLQRIIRASQ